MKRDDCWAEASADGGIGELRATRREALWDAGFATEIVSRRLINGVYWYESAGGSHACVGRVRDLLANGFEFPAAVPQPEEPRP